MSNQAISLAGKSFDMFLSDGDGDENRTPISRIVFSEDGSTISSVDGIEPDHVSLNQHLSCTNAMGDPALGWNWFSAEGRFWTGMITFSDEFNFTGALETVRGERLSVVGRYVARTTTTAQVVEEESPTSAPPNYKEVSSVFSFSSAPSMWGSQEMPQLGQMTFSGIASANWGELILPNGEVIVDGTLFSTRRRLKVSAGSAPARWERFCTVFIGSETRSGIKAPVVYVDMQPEPQGDVDVSRQTLVSTSETINLHCAYSSDELDFEFGFTISLNGAGAQRSFTGTWKESEEEYEWEGFYSSHGRKSRKAPAPIPTDPKGRTLSDLLAISSRVPEATKSEEGGSTTRTARMVDMAQQKADQIYHKILLNGLPEQHRKKIFPGLPSLDDEEAAVASQSSKFVEHASVILVLQHLSQSKEVDEGIKKKIKKDKLDDFWKMCTSNSTDDYMARFGWDANTLEEIRTGFSNLTHQCFQLGYCRTISQFREFMEYPQFWYHALAQWLVSPENLERLELEVNADRMDLLTHLMEYHTQLVLLRDAKGENGEAVVIGDESLQPDRVMKVMTDRVLLAVTRAVQWDDRMKRHFEEIVAALNEEDASKFAKSRHLIERFQKDRSQALKSDAIQIFGQGMDLFRAYQGTMPISKILDNKVPNDIGLKAFSASSQHSFEQFKRLLVEYGPLLKGICAVVAVGYLMQTVSGEDVSADDILANSGAILLTFGQSATPFATLVGQAIYSVSPSVLQGIFTHAKGVLTSDTFKAIGTFLSKAFVIALAIAVTISAWHEWQQALKHGTRPDKWLTGIQAITSGIYTLAVLGYSGAEFAAGLGWIGSEMAVAAVSVCGVIGFCEYSAICLMFQIC
ncbi:hypothetical protein FRC03_000816 [Tulasnella sp. 419]|nr:hypothetical protein FRC03_000816 [Tulasnella sp. 419]